MGNSQIEAQGYYDSKFEAVCDAFLKNFENYGEIGAATSVVIEGETVVDIWAGYMDAQKTKLWQEDTIVQVMSTTKGIVSLIVHQLVEQRKIELDAPVAKYWPEFAKAGKENIPVRYLLTHQAGLPAIDVIQAPGAMFDWGLMTKLLAEQTPRWEPGKKCGYHALTFGWLVGQVIIGATGKTVGKLIKEMISDPLNVDFLLGFGPEYDDRVAEIVDAPPPPAGVKGLFERIMEDLDSLFTHAFVPSMPDPEFGFNSRTMRAAGLPAIGGHTNARGLAKIYGVLACGGSVNDIRLIGSKQLELATKTQVTGVDEVLKAEWYMGLGFLNAHPRKGNVLGQRGFGFPGMGGSMSCADPECKMGFGYVMNQLGTSVPFFTKSTLEDWPEPDPRAENILRAVYSSL